MIIAVLCNSPEQKKTKNTRVVVVAIVSLNPPFNIGQSLSSGMLLSWND